MPLATSIDHSGQLRSQNNASSRNGEKQKKSSSEEEEDDEHQVTTTGGDIWNHIILKQYYSDDGSVSINSATSSSSENKSGRSNSNRQQQQQQQQQKIMKKESSSVPSPPETSRPRPQMHEATSSSTSNNKTRASSSQIPATSTAAAAARNNSKGPKTQQQQQQHRQPPIPRPSGTNWNNRTLPTAPPLTTNNSNNNSERSTLSNNTNRSNTQNQKIPREVSNSSSSSSSSHSSSLSSETLSSGGGEGGGGKQKQKETLHPSREITAASVAAALASTSNTSYKQPSQPTPPPPPPPRQQQPPPPQIQPRQPSLKSKEPPPKTNNITKVQQRPRIQVNHLNRRAGLQQTRAMASIPNLTNWNDPKYQSPNSPKKPQKQTLGAALSNVVHDVVNVVTPTAAAAADAANNNTRSAAAAAAAAKEQEASPPTTTNAHTGVKEESNSRFGFCRSTGFWYFVIWAVWLLGGTAFYGYGREGQTLTLGKAFYMAVNIGYSIGFGYPAEVDQGGYLWFSTFYVLVGSSLVAVALGFFADKIVEDADDWFINLLQKQEYKRKMTSKNVLTKITAWITYHSEELRSIGFWIFWICMMVMYSMIHIGWPVSQAQYFAISSCSTGGHWSIPIDSPDWFFGITGLVVAFGVPIMGVAMATIGQFIAKSNKKELEDIKDTINAPVTAQEIKMMQQFGLEDGDGEVDEAEFIILCMCRLGTDPRIIEYIGQRFRKLDVDGGGSLSMREIVGRDSLDDDMPLNDMSLDDIQEHDDEDESESTSNPI